MSDVCSLLFLCALPSSRSHSMQARSTWGRQNPYYGCTNASLFEDFTSGKTHWYTRNTAGSNKVSFLLFILYKLMIANVRDLLPEQQLIIIYNLCCCAIAVRFYIDSALCLCVCRAQMCFLQTVHADIDVCTPTIHVHRTGAWQGCFRPLHECSGIVVRLNIFLSGYMQNMSLHMDANYMRAYKARHIPICAP